MTISRTQQVLPLIAGGCLLLGTGIANADGVTIGLDVGGDGTYEKIIEDGGAGDSTNLAGAVTFNGSVGAWILNVTTGVSQPILTPPRLDLNSVNATSGTGGTLVVSVWDSFTVSPSPAGFMGSIGGTTDGTVDVTYGQYAAGSTDSSTVSAGPFAPSVAAFSADTALQSLAGVEAFDLRIDVTIKHTIKHTAGFQITSFDAKISPVPIPAAAWLFGSALLGTVALGRRRKDKNEDAQA